MISLYIPIERQEIVLKKAGYWYHPTQGSDGLTVYGYILGLPNKVRWHAILGHEWLNIHQDKTVNGFHKLNWRKGIEEREKHRIETIYREIYPKHLDPKMNVSRKGEFAPNLRELQKNHKTAIQSQEIAPPSPDPLSTDCA